jgi:hypothetical protein
LGAVLFQLMTGGKQEVKKIEDFDESDDVFISCS